MAKFQIPNPHHSIAGDNAMTEIALALAMGFFAIMILTLVSMGAGTTRESKMTHDMQKDEKKAFLTAVLAPITQENLEKSVIASTLQSQDQLVIYYKGQFMDEAMLPLSLDNLSSQKTDRVILALSPKLPMAEALDVRGQIPAENLVVSTLDTKWLERLAVDFGQE